MPARGATHQRLLDEGMRLFAERGFSATTVGDIEAAAGLQPRRGALYKHFDSKEALLEAGVRARVEAITISAAQVGRIDLPDALTSDRTLLSGVLAGLASWFLDELDQQRDITRIIEHDAPRLASATESIRRGIIDAGNSAASRLLAAAAPELTDPDATAVLLVGSLVALRRTAWTFGTPPMRVTDQRAIAAWTDLVLATLHPRARG